MKPWKKDKAKKSSFKWSNTTPKKAKPKVRTKPWVKRPDGSLIMRDYHDIETW